jgi:hypothetical protein
MKRLDLGFESTLKYLVVLGLLVLALRALPVAAATCLVPSSAYPTIQAAVDDPTCDPIDVAAGT